MYAVFIQRSAQKSLESIPLPYRDRVVQAIRALALNPRLPGVKKLSGREAWRIRVGDYRIVYEISDENRTVLVVVVRHRREAYR